jgi:hypothetical protein
VKANFFLRQGLIHPCKMLGVPGEGREGALADIRNERWTQKTHARRM